VKEPEQVHISQAEKLVFSENPSARASFPGGVTLGRCYDRLEVRLVPEELEETLLSCPGEVLLGEYRVVCAPAEETVNDQYTVTVCPEGPMVLRSRRSGDCIRLSGGTKQLKKLFIDRKIPAALRSGIPVLCDDRGILGVCGVGADLDRMAKGMPAVTVRFMKREP
jgi:tRNA(Ile)-lysidine synthase